MKKLALTLFCAGLLALGSATASAQPAQKSATAPKSVIHVVTVSWKEGTTDAQIKAALDGVQALPKNYPGITRVWTRTVSAQGGKSHAFVMEFADEKALKDYTDSPAQLEWYKVYLPIRGQSTTFDISN
jgi:antibiotic biosynthesis monooxygenase (ABM) superfamily enzyme